MLLKAHHSILLRFCLALPPTLRFLSQISCHTSGHIAPRHKPRLSPWLSPLLPFYTHTHTLSLSLSLSLFFPSASCYFGFSILALAFSPSVTPPASCHTLSFTSSLVRLAHIFEAEASLTRLVTRPPIKPRAHPAAPWLDIPLSPV